ncbi:MAG TPA: hypothetical protein VFD58_22440 [Blastocatellia bacterium]|nr:hypothetical protein [Blastocatellia bacterium]
MQVRALQTSDEFQRYADFGNEVYRQNPHWVPPDTHHLVRLLDGGAPYREHAQAQAFWVEENDRILATVTAVVDEKFNRHWQEQTGHLVLFEALPGHDEAVVALLRTACEWLRERQSAAARFNFLIGWQMPLTIDAYEATPSFLHGFNPAYYHCCVKNAGFMAERGVVQYQVEFTPELARRYEQMVELARPAGVSLRTWDFERLEEEAALFTPLYNETFSRHWGAPQLTVQEMSELTVGLKDFLVPEFTVFAEADGQTAGGVFSLPDLNQAFHPLRGKSIEENFGEFQSALQSIDHGMLLVIGVKEPWRGRGVNLAMAARSYLAMIERGYRTGSYTVVLDDNWPSRRTAEKLGCRVTRNFLTYRRELA